MTQPVLNVAVIGAGLAGTILSHALMKYPQLNVHIYEAKDEIQERGASIGLAANASRALNLLGLNDVVKKAQGVRVGSSSLIMSKGPENGTVIRDLDFDTQTVYRPALLKQLLAPIPRNSIHLSKRLLSIQDTTITFEDGTSAAADVVIGADGIRSGVRSHIMGKGHPSAKPIDTRFWDTRVVVSLDEAVEKLGYACINKEDPRQHLHVSNSGVILHDIIDNAKRVCIVAAGPMPHDWSEKKCKHTLSRKQLNETYDGWGDWGQNALDLLCGGQEELSVYTQWESPQLPKLYSGTACIIGDAAHAMTPWLGAGLSQAIEDVLVLEKVIGRCRSVWEVPAAFEAFDRTRRMHTQQVIDSSRHTAQAYFSNRDNNVALLKEKLPGRDYVLDWDAASAVQEAVKHFERLKSIATQRAKKNNPKHARACSAQL